MSIDPKTSMWLYVLYGVLTGVTAPMLQAAGIGNATQVVAIASLIAFPLGFILHGLSSPKQGPFVPTPPPNLPKD